MDKKTKERLGEIREALKKYGFDEILGQTVKSKIRKTDGDETSHLLLDDEIPVKLRLSEKKLQTNWPTCRMIIPPYPMPRSKQ